MIYKSLFLGVMFVLFLGVNKSNAQTDVCDIRDAVDAVYDAVPLDSCIGNALYVHVAKLEDHCTTPLPAKLKSKKPNILQAIGETATELMVLYEYDADMAAVYGALVSLMDILPVEIECTCD